ncbi:MAG: hypothetical protein IT445_14770 [Phycisphaeraceae bacterium]|nr:hypothetical protein [Phycisphaeraceae bacterium]
MSNPIHKMVNEVRKWADAVFEAVRQNQPDIADFPPSADQLEAVVQSLGAWDYKAVVQEAVAATMDVDARAAINALEAAHADFVKAAFLCETKYLSKPYMRLHRAAERLETFNLCVKARGDKSPPIKISEAAEIMGDISVDTVKRRLKAIGHPGKGTATMDQYRSAMMAPKDEPFYKRLEAYFTAK